MSQRLNSILGDRHGAVNSELRVIVNELYSQYAWVPRMLTYRLIIVRLLRRLRVWSFRPDHATVRVLHTSSVRGDGRTERVHTLLRADAC